MKNSGDRSRILSLDGIVVVSRSRGITTEIDGRIASVHFLEGQIVRNGDLLLQFDPTLKELDLEKAKLFLGRIKHYAPFYGQMSAPRYRENALVEAKKKAEMVTIVQLSPIHVKIAVPYSSIYELMKQGKSESERFDKLLLKLKLPDGSYFSHRGKAIVLGFDLNPKTKMGSALAEFPNPDRMLRPGLKMAVEIHEK